MQGRAGDIFQKNDTSHHRLVKTRNNSKYILWCDVMYIVDFDGYLTYI